MSYDIICRCQLRHIEGDTAALGTREVGAAVGDVPFVINMKASLDVEASSG